MTISFKEFIGQVILENLHPRLQAVAAKVGSYKKKQTEFVNTAKDIIKSGEKTGMEDNQPKGSSRAVAIHTEPHSIHLDGQPFM